MKNFNRLTLLSILLSMVFMTAILIIEYIMIDTHEDFETITLTILVKILNYLIKIKNKFIFLKS